MHSVGRLISVSRAKTELNVMGDKDTGREGAEAFIAALAKTVHCTK